ncbi:Mitochondrial tRNAs modification protein, partial [Tieghemiomyces parasiticus]
MALPMARHLLTTAGRELRILGIESSCDDTAAAVVDARGQILGEAIRGQQQVHEPSGGIVPIEAVRKHVENMPFVVKEALDRSGLGIADVDAVAVTRGPGISSCLSVGLNAAKTLAAVANKPLIGVHHMEAHALTARLCFPDQIHFPFLSLLISGGHTLLLIVHDVNRYTQLGTTRDDSVGDAFDKVARALQLPWKSGRGGGAGAALEAAARHGDPAHLAYKLKVPMSINHQVSSLDFSFSGLKADVFRRVDQQLVSQYGELTTNSDYPATDGAQPPPVFRYSGKPQPTFDPYRTLSTPLADTPTEEDIPALATGQLTPQFVFDMAAAFQTTAAQHL